MEIAKMRAARVVWSELVSGFHPENPKSLALRTHCQTSGWSLTEQDPVNNVTRTTLEAMAAVLGGTQSLHTNSMDEAIALPTDFSAKVARDTQKYIQQKTGVTRAVDPFGGSWYLEELTKELIRKAKIHIDEVESVGGIAKAIERGLPKLRIEEAAALKQARIDSAEDQIIGVNVFREEASYGFDILEVDNQAVRNDQIQRLRDLRSKRNESRVQDCLQALTAAAGHRKENILSLAVEAARARATLGEISLALEKVFGRFQANNMVVSGVYSGAFKNQNEVSEVRKLSDRFAEADGRRPRILIAKLGQDGHDRGARIIASGFADFGFDVDIAPLFLTPEEAAMQAFDADVHVLGISSLAAGHKTLVPEALAALKKLGREDILVVVGGVIPQKDYDFLFEAGASAIFGPGTPLPQAARDVLEKMFHRFHPELDLNP
jgi:methylmalonyl-CoA mutase